jgi:dUTP pyrophosphatase
MEKIKFKKIHPLAQIPKKATELAGGWDVTVTELIKKSPNKIYCKLGFALKIPKGYRLNIVPRSSFTKYNWVMNNSPGLGDADYLDEYQIRFTAIPTGCCSDKKVCASNVLETTSSLTYDGFPYNIGDRIGQIYLSKIEDINFTEVKEFEELISDRVGGFGSTGK